jgi:hypothetical protein
MGVRTGNDGGLAMMTSDGAWRWRRVELRLAYSPSKVGEAARALCI